jgi:methionine synthase II (cobalamin-independent)
MVNRTLEGIDGVETSMHLCHGHFGRAHATEGSYELIMPALQKLHVGTINMEFATLIASGVGCLADFPSGPRFGLGCIDHCERSVKSTAVIVARAEATLAHVGAARVSLHPDCGFSSSIQNPPSSRCTPPEAVLEAQEIFTAGNPYGKIFLR